MADNETIADIIAEMRKDRGVDPNLMWDNSQVEEHDSHYADRLEAAHEREIGDSAKLREALEDVLEKIDRWRTDGSMEHWQYSQLFDIADAALAAPPRNCDVGTAEERTKRFTKFCHFHASKSNLDEEACKYCPLYACEHEGEGSCVIRWGDMPYEEEEEGGAK